MSVTTRATLLASLALFSAVPAWSITAGDVLDRMSPDERGGYLSGTVEMAAFLSSIQDKKERAECIVRWYFKERKGTEQIMLALARFKDKQAMPVIHAVIKRACGE